VNAIPTWLQYAMAICGIFAFVGGALAFICVIWPSIRLQTRFINSQQTKGVDDLIDRL
jgi:hypothetical protein